MIQRTIYTIILIFICLVPIMAQDKSTMEILINKDWYELNLKTMKAHENFYIRFTGTQRLIIGIDSTDNIKARVQQYYLSNKYEDKFDSTKIGKNKFGNYIIFKGNANNAICHKIENLNEESCNLIEVSNPSLSRRIYFSDPKQLKKEGEIISTIDLLADKIWYQINPETGERLNIEHTYGYSLFVRCIMPENRKTQSPQWMFREFYLSDTIVTEFDRSMVAKKINGVYLVVNELGDNGEWQTATYDITTLSENRLVLECIYPKGYATQVFESTLYSQNAEHAKRKPQQKTLMEKEWYRIDTITWKRDNIIERYNKTHVTRTIPIKTGNDTIHVKKIYEYYMSNQPETEFDWTKKGKITEGDYIVVKEPDKRGVWATMNYRIVMMEDCNMITLKEIDNDTTLYAYERDNISTVHDTTKTDSIEKKTMMDMLVGKQWLTVRNGRKAIANIRYFTETQKISPFIYKVDGGYISKIYTYDYYLADFPDYNFSYDQQAKKRKNGKYLNYRSPTIFSEKKSFQDKILYLSDRLFIYEYDIYTEYGPTVFRYMFISE